MLRRAEELCKKSPLLRVAVTTVEELKLAAEVFIPLPLTCCFLRALNLTHVWLWRETKEKLLGGKAP